MVEYIWHGCHQERQTNDVILRILIKALLNQKKRRQHAENIGNSTTAATPNFVGNGRRQIRTGPGHVNLLVRPRIVHEQPKTRRARNEPTPVMNLGLWVAEIS